MKQLINLLGFLLTSWFNRKPKQEPKKQKFVQVGNRLIEYVEPPDFIPEEKLKAMQKKARELKLKHPTMSLERIQRKVCEEFHISIDTSKQIEETAIPGSGSIVRQINKTK